jgi:MOSC domain-containing protein YiiM
MQLLSVQIGSARRVKIGDRSVLTASSKQAVEGNVPVMPLGLFGDEQADLSIHGGLEKAVYAYPSEHYAFWRQARQQAGLGRIDNSLPHGSLGENLTLAGLLETGVWAGDVLRFSNCELRVTLPREPCYKFNASIGFARASRLMAQSGFCGFYLAVETPGALRAGEPFELIAGRRSVSIPQLFAAKMAKHLR